MTRARGFLLAVVVGAAACSRRGSTLPLNDAGADASSADHVAVDSGRDDVNAPDGPAVDITPAEPGACSPTEQHYPSQGASHVANLNGVTYNSNPPSSGKHCDSWGARGTYSAANPMPRCNWMHNLEHGWIVLLYKCQGACPEVVTALQSVIPLVTDPDCGSARVIITPDSDIDTPVAATAWQNTWKADCLDKAALGSLAQFMTLHIGTHGEAPESTICSDGTVAP